ncbi:MAG: AAA-like domain-containing protein [Scytonema sp. PMC 1069.18]|nr:AAA-like domain-containing protein [Scytonema sp. PMC 1069.18]
MDEIIDAVEQILHQKPLGSIQRFILTQSWLGKTYGEMAKGSGYGSDYIKEVGSQLWQELSEALGERVTKKNLHLVLKKHQINRTPRVQSQQEYPQESENGFSKTRTFLDLLTVTKLDFPSGPIPLSSPLYIHRPPLEELVYAEIGQPGCLIRIKAPRKMGKSSLLNRIIAHCGTKGHNTVYLDFQEADEAIFGSLDKFLRWFCVNISRQLNIASNLDDYWDEDMGSKVSCKIYFEAYLLEQINSPLVLAMNEVNRVFEHPDIAHDFLPMLRFWYEQTKQHLAWEKLRLVVVHTTEIYIPLKLNQSPFNVGLTISLPPFTLEQVRELAQRYGVDWLASESGMQLLAPIHTMVGGHPYLVSLALYHLRQGDMKLEVLLQTASTPSGIYSQHLRELLTLLQAEPQLMSAMQQVVMSDESVELDAIAAYKLESMGLVQLDGNLANPSCELYRQYFSQQLGKQHSASASVKLLEEEQLEHHQDNATDVMSQFANIHFLNHYLETEWQRWLTQASLLSLMICEIDYFKLYSDLHGYRLGSASLEQIASTIKECLHSQSVLMAHSEGTKFIAVLLHIPSENVIEIAENIRERVEKLGIAYTQSQFDGFPSSVLTVSVGIASVTPDLHNSSAMLIAAVEEALFQSRRKGRNCVTMNSGLIEDV